MVVQSNPILLTPGLLVHGPLCNKPLGPLGNLQWCRDPVPPYHVLNAMLARRYTSLAQLLRKIEQYLHGRPWASTKLVPHSVVPQWYQINPSRNAAHSNTVCRSNLAAIYAASIQREDREHQTIGSASQHGRVSLASQSEQLVIQRIQSGRVTLHYLP